LSRENVEIVRRIYEKGWIDRNQEPLLALVTSDVEFVNPPDAVDSGIRRGPAEVRRALRNLTETLDAPRHELRELFAAGNVVVARVSFAARMRGSDVDFVHEEAHTWTFRNGKIVRFEWGRDLEAALEAVGLSE
jgi:ketosteroid isomerase-like protein